MHDTGIYVITKIKIKINEINKRTYLLSLQNCFSGGITLLFMQSCCGCITQTSPSPLFFCFRIYFSGHQEPDSNKSSPAVRCYFPSKSLSSLLLMFCRCYCLLARVVILSGHSFKSNCSQHHHWKPGFYIRRVWHRNKIGHRVDITRNINNYFAFTLSLVATAYNRYLLPHQLVH